MDTYKYLQEHATIKTDSKEGFVEVYLSVPLRHKVQRKSEETEASQKIKITTPMIRAYLEMCRNMKIESTAQSSTINNEHESSLSGTWIFRIPPRKKKRKKKTKTENL